MSLEHLTIRDGYAYFCPTGEVGWQSLVSLMAQAMAECHAGQVTKLLVDVSGTTQAPMNTSERFALATGIAESWDRSIRIAMVARADQRDRDDFTGLVARNRGVVIRGFASEEEALTWLKPESK